ncbi:Protein lin-28 [Caenorhabditis elegans]|uniref:Protein lin-28 n=1 Tax=Caenorhabditis elegans TaxID=6239 RepID=LIN28_CAEEL|nr:Protein lin-28 [Caenorhabditis elegans]P92186.1 RecName: Full=Protein lin-28; AltName: Full=Abnormal cell lineage protein 28 [Caenorhabditis elegans]AAB49759.1 Lin-28 [Caenorhabditis elegans]AAC47476.1 LIN-28 [Caenorhabditis elegans]CAB61008.1 Protein lin-28 [Caenorhabditis elegans]|eukprot:NP_001021085.1 Protein lin-28 [Caenorhabditis elegans]
MSTVVSEGRNDGNNRYSPQDEVEDRLPDVVDNRLTENMRVPSFERLPSPTPRYFGSCKWFNVSKGYGFVIDDITGEDLFVHQSNLNMQGFRSLDEGERVSYYIQERSNGKGREAYAVSGEVEGQGLKGSRIHPLGRKKAVSLRCFRCGKFATHKAKSCPNVKTDAKVCYTCGSEEHVSSICPERRRKHRPEQVAAEEAEAARMAAEKSSPTTSDDDIREKNSNSSDE